MSIMAAVKSDRAQTEIDVKERARELGNRIQATSGQTSLGPVAGVTTSGDFTGGCRQVPSDGPESG